MPPIKHFFTAVAISSLSFAAGLGIHASFWISHPWPDKPAAQIIYRSDVGSDLALSVDSNGKFSFGPEYDRETEAKKLLEVAKRLADSDKSLPCTTTNYRPPTGGVITINPGTAWPLLRFNWNNS